MKKSTLAAISVLAVFASACVSVNEPVEDKTKAMPSVKKQGADEAVKEGVLKTRTGLSPQVVEAGECGLFLWTRRQSPEFVFFSKAGSETAKFWYEKTEVPLARTGVGGEVFGQQLTEQFFKLPDGRTLELEMTPGDLLIGGQRVPEATFRVKDAEGWATLIPAAGVTMCQPAE